MILGFIVTVVFVVLLLLVLVFCLNGVVLVVLGCLRWELLFVVC